MLRLAIGKTMTLTTTGSMIAIVLSKEYANLDGALVRQSSHRSSIPMSMSYKNQFKVSQPLMINDDAFVYFNMLSNPPRLISSVTILWFSVVKARKLNLIILEMVSSSDQYTHA